MHHPPHTTLTVGTIFVRARVLYARSWKGVAGAGLTMAVMFALIDYFGLGASADIGAAAAGVIMSATVVVGVWDDYVHGSKEQQTQITQRMAEKFASLVVASIVVGIGVMFGLVLLVVPGLLLCIWWSVHQPVMVREGRGVFESLRRSRALVRGHEWPCAVAWTVVWTVYLGGLVAILWNAPLEGGVSLGTAIAELLFVTVAFPLVPVTASAMYDLLARSSTRAVAEDALA